MVVSRTEELLDITIELVSVWWCPPRTSLVCRLLSDVVAGGGGLSLVTGGGLSKELVVVTALAELSFDELATVLVVVANVVK